MFSQPATMATSAEIAALDDGEAPAKIRIGDLEIGCHECDELGFGSCSTVRGAVHIPSGEHVAVKIYYECENGRSQRDQDSRDRVMHLPPHPSVVTLRSVLIDRGDHLDVLRSLMSPQASLGPSSHGIVIEVLQLCTGGELANELLDMDVLGPPPARLTWRWFAQLTAGLAHCHTHAACFGQIRPEHMLLSSSGFVARLQRPQHSILGGVKEVALRRAASPIDAPELAGRETANVTELPSGDVYAMGALGFWMLGGNRAEGLDPAQVDELCHLPRLARQLLKEMLDPEPSCRPSASVAAHWAKKALAAVESAADDDESTPEEEMRALCVSAGDAAHEGAQGGILHTSAEVSADVRADMPSPEGASSPPDLLPSIPLDEVPDEEASCASSNDSMDMGPARSTKVVRFREHSEKEEERSSGIATGNAVIQSLPRRPCGSSGYTRSGGWDSLHYSLTTLIAAVHAALRRCGECFEYNATPMPIFHVGPIGRGGNTTTEDRGLKCEPRFDYYIHIFRADTRSGGGTAYNVDVRRRYADRFRFMSQYAALRDAFTDALGLDSRLHVALSSPTLSGRSLREKDGSFKTLLIGRQIDPRAPMTCPSIPRKLNPQTMAAFDPTGNASFSKGSFGRKESSLGRDLPAVDVADRSKGRSVLGRISQMEDKQEHHGKAVIADIDKSPASTLAFHGFRRSPRAMKRRSDEKDITPMHLEEWTVPRG